MSEFHTNPFFYACIGLLIAILIMLLAHGRTKQEMQQARLERDKISEDFHQLTAKFEESTKSKNQLEQAVVKVQTYAEGLKVRLQERDENIAQQNTAWQNLLEKNTALNQELTELKTTLSEKEKNFVEQQQNFAQARQQLNVEFQNLANRILEEKTQRFSQTNQAALDQLLKPFREQIEGFQKRVNEIHSAQLKGNTELEAEIKRVREIGLNMSQQADNLTSALKGEKKTLGNWGEMQLERALQSAGLIAGEHYSAQAHFKNERGGSSYPDFVVNLPDNKHLIIDSKMSLNAYESAVNSEDEIIRNAALHEHTKAIRNHIDDLSRKDYSNLIGMRSPNFVLMFIALEPAYIEAMKADSSLFSYGYDKNVILVSYTTLMPILRTVANLWRIERGNAEAKEISEKAGDIYNQITLIAERLAKLGNSLSTVSSHYNNTVTALVGQQGLIGKVERFKSLSTKANKEMPNVELLHNDLSTERLQVIRIDSNNEE